MGGNRCGSAGSDAEGRKSVLIRIWLMSLGIPMGAPKLKGGAGKLCIHAILSCWASSLRMLSRLCCRPRGSGECILVGFMGDKSSAPYCAIPETAPPTQRWKSEGNGVGESLARVKNDGTLHIYCIPIFFLMSGAARLAFLYSCTRIKM